MATETLLPIFAHAFSSYYDLKDTRYVFRRIFGKAAQSYTVPTPRNSRKK